MSNYYDAERDQSIIEAYYEPINENSSTLSDDIANLLMQTHTRTFSYREAKRRLYESVDVHPDGSLYSIYSGRSFAPRELLTMDAVIDAAREAATQSRSTLAPPLADLDDDSFEDFLEAALPYNCEHVVPQSWFSKKSPMVSDIHHLFACESRCNSFRSNIPYFDFPPLEVIMEGCGEREGEDKFEPVAGKGAVARATLYFMLRYPEVIQSTGHYDATRIQTLLNWHRQQPPDEYERHRNLEIYLLQGNRNPLIDFPHWADKLDFISTREETDNQAFTPVFTDSTMIDVLKDRLGGSSSKVGQALRGRAIREYDVLDVNIFLRLEPAEALNAHRSFAVSDTDGGAAAVADSDPVSYIRDQTLASQADLVDFLSPAQNVGLTNMAFEDGNITEQPVRNVQQFWINNAVGAEVTPAVLEAVLRRDDVAFVEINHHASLEELLDVVEDPATRAVGLVTDTSEPTWSVKHINAPKLWQLGITGQGVTVAVLDNGVHYDHPDLKDRMWDGAPNYPKHGYDFENGDHDPQPGNTASPYHGTCCAGIVAGDGTSGQQTGVAPGARIMALRVGGNERSFWEGMQFAVDHGAQVISMSMTWKNPNNPNYPGWRRVSETLLASKILHANSSGNQGNLSGNLAVPFNIGAPGNCPPPQMHVMQPSPGGVASAITCGNTNSADQLESSSGRGPSAWESGPYMDYPYQNGAKVGLLKPDICAPGTGTISCSWPFDAQPGERPYMTFGGTSGATPHVGGCLALLASACLHAGTPIDPARMQEALQKSAVRIVGQTQDKENHFGAGRVDVYAAYLYGRGQGWW